MLAGRLSGQAFGALLDIVWLVFWFGSGVWSMGRLATGSIVRFGGTVVRCVCRLFCVRLEDWSVSRSLG